MIRIDCTEGTDIRKSFVSLYSLIYSNIRRRKKRKKIKISCGLSILMRFFERMEKNGNGDSNHLAGNSHLIS